MKTTIEFTEENRISLISTTDSLIRKFDKEIPMLRKSLTGVHNVEMANEISFHFASSPLLLRLSLIDLCILFKLFLSNKSVAEKNTLLRIISGQLYEFSEDVQEIFGKKYRKLLNRIESSENLVDLFNNNVIKEFHQIKKKHSDFLKIIRHNVSHHKDLDALFQYYLINDIDFNWAIKAYSDYVDWYVTSYSDFELKLIDIATKQSNK
jgi:hypothetical protein